MSDKAQVEPVEPVEQDLSRQVLLLQSALQGANTLSIAFLPNGTILAATISGDGSPEILYAAQKALQGVAQSLTKTIMQTLKGE